MRRGFEKGCRPPCTEEENALHILLKNSETEWKGQFLGIKWLTVNEEIAYKNTVNRTNAVELKNIGKYLSKIKCKHENKISTI
jgi:hypothetical protein